MRKLRIIERNDGTCEVQMLYAFWNTGSWETEKEFGTLKEAQQWADDYKNNKLPQQIKQVWTLQQG